MIREATEADVPAVAVLARKFLETTDYGRLMPNVPQAQLEGLIRTVMHLGVIFLAEAREPWRDTPGTVVVATVGMIALCDLEHPITGLRYADEIAWFVDPEHRNGTVGPRLLAQSEVWARSKQLHMVKMVAPAGTDVGRFYERLGYRAVETAYQKEIS